MEGTKYSFSRLETFHNCKRSYYYTYILNERGGDNIYSFLGTIVHELTQGMIEGKETNKSAVEKFIASIDDADLLGLEWMSEKVKENYTECIVHFLENYSPLKLDELKIEDYFEVNINGNVMRGYIDFWYFQNDELHIIDFKTSSKFSRKDLIHKQRQLSLYAYALSQKYPNVKIKIYFHMLKYAKQNNKLTERNKLNIFEDFEEGFVEIEYNDELKEDLIKYVCETVDEIDLVDCSDKLMWEMAYNPNVDFFCKNLCGFRERCIKNINKVY